jgi:hypothetical protein
MRFVDLKKNLEATTLALKYAQNKLEEASFSLEFSVILDKAANGKITVSDLDKIVHKGNDLIAAFELKIRKDDFRKYILLNSAQYITLRDISTKLEVPLYYLIWHKPIDKYRILRLKDDWKDFVSLGKGYSLDNYVRVPLQESLLLSKEELIEFLKDLLSTTPP